MYHFYFPTKYFPGHTVDTNMPVTVFVTFLFFRRTRKWFQKIL